MKLHIIVVRDIVANVWGQPQFVASVGGAIRSFGDLVNDPKKGDVVSQHPEHFELWYLGVYDDETADFIWDDDSGKDVKKQIAAGANMVINRQ